MDRATKLFLNHRNLIRQQSWQAAERWKMDFEELEAEAHLIFMETVKKFDLKKSNYNQTEESMAFNTYLKKRLSGKLSNYCRASRRRGGTLASPSDDYPSKEFDKFCEVFERMDFESQLSADSRIILKYLVDCDWFQVGSTKRPKWEGVERDFLKKGWKSLRIRIAWRELKLWWRSYCELQYGF